MNYTTEQIRAATFQMACHHDREISIDLRRCVWRLRRRLGNNAAARLCISAGYGWALWPQVSTQNDR